MTEKELTREELIEKLLWNSGGYGYGLCYVAGFLAWAFDRPGPGERDLKSIVAVSEPKDKYSDEELKKIVDFSEKQTGRYDEMCEYRRGGNLIFLNKESNGKWMGKRLSWERPSYFDSLERAFESLRI